MQKYANLVELENSVKLIFSCKNSFWYSREQARQKFAKFANFANERTKLPKSREHGLLRGRRGLRRALLRRGHVREGLVLRTSRPATSARGSARTKTSNISKIISFLQIFGGLVLGCIETDFCKKICVSAFFKLCKICTLLHRSTFNILAKNRFKKSWFFVKIQPIALCKFCKITLKYANFCKNQMSTR